MQYNIFENSSFDMINYISGGFSSDFRNKYDIAYRENRVKLSKNLENNILKNKELKSESKPSNVNPYERMMWDYFKEINKLASSVIETYNNVKDKVIDATIEIINGGYRISFVNA